MFSSISESPSRPWSPLTFSPARLTVSEGADAIFTCSFSNWSEHHVLNWYRLSPSNQTEKLAAFLKGRSEPGPDPRFQVAQLPNGHDFHMIITATKRNDSGIYLCGAIFLPPWTKIKESPGAELTVTGAARGPGRVPRDPPGPHSGLCLTPPVEAPQPHLSLREVGWVATFSKMN
jgi:programmed cell death 1 ligand 1